MARALECPACGARTPLQALPAAETFRCQRCGQVLKVPSSGGARGSRGAQAPAGSPPAPPRRSRGAGAGAASSAAAPSPGPAGAPTSPAPPRRRGAPAAAGVTAAAVSATVDQRGAPTAAAPADGGRRTRGTGRAPASGATPGRPPRAKVAWYWRVVAWIVAVPLGLVLTGWPAFRLKGIRKDDLLDVFVGTGTGRYTRLAAFTLVWALVTALLVQIFVEGGRWLAARRRARKAAAPAPVAPLAAAPARPGRPPASARR